MVVAFRRHTLLLLDDCLYALQPSVPRLTRSALHRCLQRHGISRLPETDGDQPTRQRFKAYPIGFFDIDEHRLTKPHHPWTNGQVERMNRTLKEATVRCFHYGSHDKLRQYLALFLDAYNYARRLKTLKGMTPYEATCRWWATEPQRSDANPHHEMPGPNI